MLPMPCDVPDDVELARLKSSELTRGLGGNADRHAISQGRRPKDQKLAKVLRVTCTEEARRTEEPLRTPARPARMPVRRTLMPVVDAAALQVVENTFEMRFHAYTVV